MTQKKSQNTIKIATIGFHLCIKMNISYLIFGIKIQIVNYLKYRLGFQTLRYDFLLIFGVALLIFGLISCPHFFLAATSSGVIELLF